MRGFKKRLLVSLAILVGAGLLLSVFIILLNGDINKSLAAIGEHKDSLNQRNLIIQQLTESAAKLEKVKTDITLLNSVVPDQDELINFPEEVTNLGREYHISTSFKFQDREDRDKPIAKYLFDMALTGQYEDIVDFLERIETYPYIIYFPSIKSLKSYV